MYYLPKSAPAQSAFEKKNKSGKIPFNKHDSFAVANHSVVQWVCFCCSLPVGSSASV